MIQAGRTLVAGADANAQLVSSSQTIGGGFTDVPYHLDFPDDNVAVMTQVQTNIDPSFVKTRQKSIRDVGLGKGFAVMLESGTDWDPTIVAGTGHQHGHEMEHVGWMAFQHGVGAMGRDIYQAGLTPEEVTHDPCEWSSGACAALV